VSEEIDWGYVRENLHRMLARTRDGVQRVANIVSNLRGLARTSPPKMETVLIADLLESALEMIRGRMRRHNIEVKVEHAADVPRLTCVPSQISQVILNLLINAVQAIESTGREQGGVVHFTTATEGDSILMTVSDDGCGVDPESIPRLFDPFFTTKSVGEGTGLGLSITHGIITGHGGRIEVESRPGEGTRFRIYLPLKSSS
jgi:signal transduction histidine kinase